MVSFPYHSHIFRDSYGNSMGPAYHKGVPWLGVPGITLDNHSTWSPTTWERFLPQRLATHKDEMIQFCPKTILKTDIFYWKSMPSDSSRDLLGMLKTWPLKGLFVSFLGDIPRPRIESPGGSSAPERKTLHQSTKSHECTTHCLGSFVTNEALVHLFLYAIHQVHFSFSFVLHSGNLT